MGYFWPVVGSANVADGTPVKVVRGNALGGTLTRPDVNEAGTKIWLAPENDTLIEDVSLTLTEDTGPAGGVHVMELDNNNVRLNRVVLDGGVEVVGGVRNFPASIGLVQNNDTCDGFSITNSIIRNFAYTLLGANGITGFTGTRFNISFNLIEDFANPTLLWNHPDPSSSAKDILVLGNSIGANNNAAGTAHRGSFAGQNVRAGRVAFNYFFDAGAEMWRLEEGANSHVFTGNIADLSGEHGFEVTTNNVGGTYATPYKIIKSDTILTASAGASGSALHEVFSANGPPLHTSILHDLIIDGSDWDYGIRTATEPQSVLHHHSLIHGLPVGLRMARPTQSIRDTMLVDVAQPLSAGAGGVVGPLHFRKKASGLPTAITDMLTIESGSAPVGTTEWTWEAQNFTLANGAQIIDMFQTGYFMSGRISLMYTHGNTHRQTEGVITWDGTTLTYTSALTRGSGTAVFPSGDPNNAFINNSGMLAVQITNGSGGDLTGGSLFIRFSGLHSWT